MRSIQAIVFLLLLVCLLAVAGSVVADGEARLVVYYSPECESCHLAREQILPAIVEEYGDDLTLEYVDVTQPIGLARLESDEARLGSTGNPLPVLVYGDQIVADTDLFALEDALRDLLRRELGDPSGKGSSAASPGEASPSPLPPSHSSSEDRPHIHVAYVEKDGCKSCARAVLVIQALEQEYPQLIVTTLNNVRDADVVEAMGEEIGLPEGQRLVAPSIYVGADALLGDDITTSGLRSLLDSYASDGSPEFWADLDPEGGQASIVQRFQTMGPAAVVLAALIDGINPCAFATILFFVSYLAVSRRGRSSLLLVGLAFTAGVFITYLLVGLGFMGLLQLASGIRAVGLILYSAMAVGCFVLAGLSIYDYTLARKGKLHEMRLNLPDPLRERIKGRIRAKSGAYVGAAFVSGLIVSLLELACTGQVYLPTISFVVGIPEMRAYAVGYLFLYNVVFVLPLLAVLLLAVYGVSTSRFQDWFIANAARAKLIMAILFLLLGALLLAQFVSLIQL